jgi:hypothetical protein
MKLRRERSSRKASSSVERLRAWVVAGCRAAGLALRHKTAAQSVAAIRWAVLMSREETKTSVENEI